MLLKKGNFTGNNSEELATNDWNPIQTAIGHKLFVFLSPCTILEVDMITMSDKMQKINIPVKTSGIILCLVILRHNTPQ